MDENVFVPGENILDLPGQSTTSCLHMIFLVDNSGSMRNRDSGGRDRMSAVNDAFEAMVPELQSIQMRVNSAFTIYISILVFNEDPEWHVRALPIENYIHQPIEASPYVTFYSRAYEDLCAQLSRSALLSQPGKMSAPYIMLMTDGRPTDGDPYEDALQKLRGNGWFDAALRYAVLIGEDTVRDPMARQAVEGFVTDSQEGILDAADAREIASKVSAHTIVNVERMTHRANPTGFETPAETAQDPMGGLGTGEPESPLYDPDLVF